MRHNWVHVPWAPASPPTDVAVTETYTYRSRDGRVSQRDTTVSSNQRFTQSWTYDELGTVRGRVIEGVANVSTAFIL